MWEALRPLVPLAWQSAATLPQKEMKQPFGDARATANRIPVPVYKGAEHAFLRWTIVLACVVYRRKHLLSLTNVGGHRMK